MTTLGEKSAGGGGPARTWLDNALEFHALDEGEGWPFAVLVACSVEKDAGHGGAGHRNDRNDGPKTSAREFAEQAGTSAPRVLRYLTGWERAAAQGLVPAAEALSPGDVHSVPLPDALWAGVYDASHAGGRPRDSKPEDAIKILDHRGVDAVLEAMPVEQRVEVAAALLSAAVASPEFRDEVEHRAEVVILPDPADRVRPSAQRKPKASGFDVIEPLRRASDLTEDALRALGDGALAGDLRSAVEVLLGRLRATLDFIESSLDGSAVTDEALAEFLGGDRS